MTLEEVQREKAMSQGEVSATVREWRESAEYWEKHAAIIRTMFAPVTRALIEDADIQQGHRVLDVAAGPGEPSLTIADVVGPSGSVVSTDVVRAMVEAAKRESRRRAITNIEFFQCSADSLPLADNEFDRVVCRLGVMFFPEPLAALREMMRVTKHNGKIALAVWGRSELNPFSYAVTNVVSRFIEVPPVEPNAQGAFRFAERGALAQVLEKAGARDIKERVISFHIEAEITPREFWEMRSQTSGTLREKLAALPDEIAGQIGNEVQQAVREFFPGKRMKFPAQMIVVAGRKN